MDILLVSRELWIIGLLFIVILLVTSDLKQILVTKIYIQFSYISFTRIKNILEALAIISKYFGDLDIVPYLDLVQQYFFQLSKLGIIFVVLSNLYRICEECLWYTLQYMDLLSSNFSLQEYHNY
jgi:hypothetical protein